jgi:hypothetical protein
LGGHGNEASLADKADFGPQQQSGRRTLLEAAHRVKGPSGMAKARNGERWRCGGAVT